MVYEGCALAVIALVVVSQCDHSVVNPQLGSDLNSLLKEVRSVESSQLTN